MFNIAILLLTLLLHILSIESVYAEQINESINHAELKRNIDSSKFPLVITTYKGHFLENEKYAGGIFSCNSETYVFSRLGSISKFNGTNFIKNTSIKNIDLGFTSEAIENKYELNTGTFRLHKLKCDEINKYLYATHEFYNSSTQKPEFRLSRIKIKFVGANIISTGDWQALFQSEPLKSKPYIGAAGGGGLAVNDLNYVYFAIGDYNLDGVLNRENKNNAAYIAAQDTKSKFGKVYRLRKSDGYTELFSKGHRNPQSLLFDTDKKLYLTEHGPQGGDKIISVLIGKNYGWPYLTYGSNYGSYKWPLKSSEDFGLPLFSFVPSIGISSIIKIDNFHEEWNDDFIITSLKFQSIFRIRIRENRVIFSEPIFIGERIRDGLIKKNKIYFWTDLGNIIALEINKSKLTKNKTNQDIKYAALEKCLVCHHLGVSNSSHIAPSLSGLIGRFAGSDPGFNKYSDAIKTKKNLIWNRSNLENFLKNPHKIIENTNMPNLNLSSTEVENAIKIIEGL